MEPANVLIVDDDVDIRSLLRDDLGKHGYSASAACAPRVAMQTTLRPVFLSLAILSGMNAAMAAESDTGGGLIAPAAGTPWRSETELPRVPEPPVAAATLASAPVQALSLPQLTHLALDNNPATRQAWAAARAQAASLGIARSFYFPQVDALASITRSKSISSSGAAVPAQVRYGPSLSLSYLLFDFGARAGQVEAARYRLLAANLLQNRVLQDVVLGVEQTYYQVLGLDQLVGANRQALSSIETSLAAANTRRLAGLATLGDVYRAETAVGQAQLILRRNEGELAKARGQLAVAVGMPVDTPLVLERWPDAPPVSEMRESVGLILDEAKMTRPDLVAAEAQARAAQAGVRIVQSAGRPTLALTGNAGLTAFADERPVSDSYGVGVTLRIPLFSGFNPRYSVRQAQALAEQAAAERDRMFRQTELEVWQAYFDLNTAAAAVATSQTVLKSAEQSAEVALGRYRSGVGSLLDLLTAQADQANARVQTIQAQLDWYTGLAALAYARGALPLTAADH